MIEDLLQAVKEKDTKLRKVEQEHVQVQNDLIIKNMKLLQEREETFKKLNNRNAQIDEYKYNINDMTMKLEKLRHEIIFNEDKLIEENEMLKTRLRQENINYKLKLDAFQTDKDNMMHENAMQKKLIEEKDLNLNILLKQEQETNKLLREEKTDAEKSLEKMSEEYKVLLLDNERLEVELRQSEQNLVKMEDKMKNQVQKQDDDHRNVEEKMKAVQKESSQKSHKINFLLKKIESDCEEWNSIETDLKREICDLNSLLSEKQNLLTEKEQTIQEIRYTQHSLRIFHITPAFTTTSAFKLFNTKTTFSPENFPATILY